MRYGLNPYFWLGLLNVLTGSFSAIMGVKKVLSGVAVAADAGITGNPWTYVVGGVVTVLIGIGNWRQGRLATLATVLMILGSLLNAWFGYHGVLGAAPKFPVPILTLNAYVVVLSTLVIWARRQRAAL